jgi:hypothetical protein
MTLLVKLTNLMNSLLEMLEIALEEYLNMEQK